MTRLLAATVVIGGLLAAPALAQTMSRAPAPSASDTMSTPDQTAAPAQAGRAKPVKPTASATQGSGSSMRPARRHHDRSSDHVADQLNRQELQSLQSK